MSSSEAEIVAMQLRDSEYWGGDRPIAVAQWSGPVCTRFTGGYATAIVGTVEAIVALPELSWSDIRMAVAQIVEDPSVLPEAIIEPFRERIAVGDYAGEVGMALPEVISGVAALGRVRAAAAALPEGLPITKDMLDTRGRLEGGLHNAGSHAPRFDKWLDDGGTIRVTPDGYFEYTRTLEVGREMREISVVYRDGFPDFPEFMTHPSGVTSVEITMTGNYGRDYRAANIEAGHSD